MKKGIGSKINEKRILVPIDFSGINKAMVDFAVDWAKRTDAKLYFLKHCRGTRLSLV